MFPDTLFLILPRTGQTRRAGHLRFSAIYAAAEEQARRCGWQTRELRGEHLHMLVKPAEVARALIDLAETPQHSSVSRPAD